MYRIGEFSKMSKLTVKTLRFYEEAELLTPSYTDKFTGYRYYENTQLFTVQMIVSLRQAGFSIDEIRRVFSGENLSKMFQGKEADLTKDKQLAEERLNRFLTIKKFYAQEQHIMSYQAIVKSLPQYTVYYKQFKVHKFEDYATVIPEIGATVASANPTLKCVEPNYCFIEYLDQEFKEQDAFVEYDEAIEKKGVEIDGIKFKTIPACEVASVMIKGGYEGLGRGFAYLAKWIQDNGYTKVGNAREWYIDGCWNKESENDYLTEIQFPVKKSV